MTASKGSRPGAGAPDRPVWLVGMMGCGKSTVGPVLARLLGRPFLDADDEIARRAGRSVPEIFRAEGEAGFRARESAVIEEATTGSAVVALGGGAIAQPGASARLGASGTVVYLRAGPAALLARIGDPSSRPLLAGLPKQARAARLAALLAEREEAYLTAAIVVDTERRAVSEIARDLAERLAGDLRPSRGTEASRP